MLIQADARRIPLADGSVQCCVTSPPYWSLRDYGLPPSIFGGDAECEHVWGDEQRIKSTAQQDNGPGGGVWNAQTRGTEPSARRTEFDVSTGAFCALCGAWRGCLGLEPTPSAYVAHMVEVFREVWRVLRDDGTCWLNLGDSYAAGKSGRTDCDDVLRRGRTEAGPVIQRKAPPGLKPKDLVGIPWRVAFALQADGWWLRSDIIWHKPNPMPESVTDRPTKAHEYIFLLAKSKRYYYDADAVRESANMDSGFAKQRLAGKSNWSKATQAQTGRASIVGQVTGNEGNNRLWQDTGTRNRRTVWTIATRPYSGAHFATYPPALVEPCILAGTSAKGACPECGGPWERVVEREGGKSIAGPKSTEKRQRGLVTAFSGYDDGSIAPTFHTIGWRPTCDCGREDVKPCLVLDPFAGSGTTGMVAIKHGREFVGLDLNGDYLHELATERMNKIQKVLL